MDNSNNDSKPVKQKRPLKNVIAEIFAAIAIAAAVYIIPYFLGLREILYPMLYIVTNYVLLIIAVFAAVKFAKKNKIAAAIIIFILIAPIVLYMLVLGACLLIP